MEVGNITKAATKFLSAKLWKHTITFSVALFFNIFKRQTLMDDFWGLNKNINCAFPLSLVYQNAQWKVKISEYSKVNHSKNTGREEALNFTVDINITPQNYSFMSENCFKKLFCTHLISGTSY